MIIINDVLSKEECQQLIDWSEGVGYHQAQVSTEQGKKTVKSRRNNARFEFKNAKLANMIWERIREQAPYVSGFKVTGLNSKFKIYRYHSGQRFSWHQDAAVAKGFYEKSKYTLLVYLSDDFIGGETQFMKNKKITAYKPVQGSVLMFEHSQIHQGDLLVSGVKYVLRNDVFYKRKGIYADD